MPFEDEGDTKCIWSILFLAKVVFGDALKSRVSEDSFLAVLLKMVFLAILPKMGTVFSGFGILKST